MAGPGASGAHVLMYAARRVARPRRFRFGLSRMRPWLSATRR